MYFEFDTTKFRKPTREERISNPGMELWELIPITSDESDQELDRYFHSTKVSVCSNDFEVHEDFILCLLSLETHSFFV